MLLEYDRPVPPEWREELARLTPPHQRISWLELVWESGDRPSEAFPGGAPVQRWVIYEVTPPEGVPGFKRDTLLEEPPRSAGHHRMRRYFLEHGGALMEPFWVIQGTRGGHKFHFSDAEQSILYLQDLPWEPPVPGSLPYAPFDSRVIEQIQKWDRLRKGYGDNVRLAKKLGDKQALQDMRRSLVAFLEEQVQDVIEQVDPEVNDNTIDLDDSEAEPDWEERDRQYIEDGQIVHYTSTAG
jgi:hypothetical protein